MACFDLLTISLILCSVNQAAGEVYYITTNSTDLCTIQPCLTLSQFAANSSYYHHSNTMLVFLPGTHYLIKVNLTLSSVDNFAMKSENSTAQIKCTSYSHFHFSESQCIYITNLELIGCGGNLVKDVESFVIQNTKFNGVESSRTALEMIETTAEIVNSTFVSNRNGSYRTCILFGDAHMYLSYPLPGQTITIGGAIIPKKGIVNISQSIFEDNGADFGGAILIEQSCTIYLSKTIFVRNNARKGGVMISSSS